MRPAFRETQATVRHPTGRVARDQLWATVAGVSLLSAGHIVLIWARLEASAQPGWAAALALVVFPPMWAGLAFLRTTYAPLPQPFQVGALGWGTAVVGLHLLYHGHRDTLMFSAVSHPLVAWCLLWTGLFYVHFYAQPYLWLSGISARQSWKLGGAALSTVGVVFWGWPLRDWPLAGPGLLYFALAVVLLGSGGSLSACAYLERLGSGISNWPLRRFLGSLLQTLGVLAMLASMTVSVLTAGQTVLREALAAGLATTVGALCLLQVVADEWRYYRGSVRPE